MYVCICNGITDREIRREIDAGACRLRDLRDRLGLCNNCGKCGQHAKRLLDEAKTEQSGAVFPNMFPDTINALPASA